MRRLFTAIVAAFSLVGCSKSKVTTATIEWVHPDLLAKKKDVIADAAVASRLFALFDGIDQVQNGTPWDTPFYDAEITFSGADGVSYRTKVYLPRAEIWPGMWKHPDGVLMHFDAEAKQPAMLIEILGPLVPKEPIYPEASSDVQSVPYDRGIPNFRHSVLPIRGDYSR